MITSGAGFTLIELLVALAIIGVLVSSLLLVLSPVEQFKKSRDVQRKNDLEQMKIALDIYYNNNNLYPLGSGIIQGTSWGSSWQPYMVKLPKDPLDTQSYCYESDGSLYRLSAKLERGSDPQATPEIICAGDSYNYAVTSTNTSVIVYGSPTPTPFALPTSTPMPTSIPTSIPTSTPTPNTYSQSFTEGVTATTQCTAWNSWRASLTGTYSKITLSGSVDPVGVSCAGATANTLCQNLRTGTSTSASCDGRIWVIGPCGGGIELNANGSLCGCSNYTVRPCVGNFNWGSIAISCGAAPSQTLTVVCE